MFVFPFSRKLLAKIEQKRAEAELVGAFGTKGTF
jgi:hypothetical protein